ncbi:hypothetical protein FRC03_002204 [Tulasnella sp. 419]|nr:hypothetical protein FRC03_002204 [Tulasnella sp. 419]
MILYPMMLAQAEGLLMTSPAIMWFNIGPKLKTLDLAWCLGVDHFIDRLAELLPDGSYHCPDLVKLSIRDSLSKVDPNAAGSVWKSKVFLLGIQ